MYSLQYAQKSVVCQHCVLLLPRRIQTDHLGADTAPNTTRFLPASNGVQCHLIARFGLWLWLLFDRKKKKSSVSCQTWVVVVA